MGTIRALRFRMARRQVSYVQPDIFLEANGIYSLWLQVPDIHDTRIDT